MALTVAQAAEQWADAKRRLAPLEAQLDEAAAVLKAHFRKTGRTAYKGLVGYACTHPKFLDHDKVKAFLGKRLAEFQVSKPRETLSLLDE